MLTSYIIKNNMLVLADSTDHIDVTIFKNYTKVDENAFIEKYSLPRNIFYLNESEPTAPRYEKILNPILGETLIIVLSNISFPLSPTSVEERIEHHVFILSKHNLFWFIDNPHSTLDIKLMEEHPTIFTSRESIILYISLLSCINYKKELDSQKAQIQFLNKQADRASNVNLISQVALTEQDLVILQHTIDSHELAIRNLLDDKEFISIVNNEELVHDVKWFNHLVNKEIDMYRDLFDTVSNLYSDIINNNLNQIMRYLSSQSNIIAVSALIAGLWGMNTGGLFFEDHSFGTVIMILISIVAGYIMYHYLKTKNFFDE